MADVPAQQSVHSEAAGDAAAAAFVAANPPPKAAPKVQAQPNVPGQGHGHVHGPAPVPGLVLVKIRGQEWVKDLDQVLDIFCENQVFCQEGPRTSQSHLQ